MLTKLKPTFYFILLSAIMLGCGTPKSIVETQVINMDTIVVRPEKPLEYQASAKREFDLIHTVLDVRFDWEKQQLNGKATLTLRPYFYNQNTLQLDAKGFDIHKVAMKHQKDSMIDLQFQYDTLKLSITLPKVYTRKDTIQVYVEYTAKPEEISQKGSSAITDAKGLYFINPKGETPDKPQQIWTQGETEASSCWFPTIDRPNEKMTQEIYITVNKKYKTLSNGTLEYQMENKDGTRTDYWVQKLPHTPYLVMMAIGDFAVVEDSWRDTVDVHYYVEHDYKPYAKDIFGHTPEMMEFFSNVLGVDYPWDKYHQVVVRDYVSGAMENTSAVIHGEFLHKNKRELIDGDNQDIIAHELFHHWFGDLVTCESWSNLPLNESFATYGEYLWNEYKHGREFADSKLHDDLRSYLRESSRKQVDLIRFEYDNKEDMFDSHSYAKGGRILHMLRNYVGDEAFFESLQLYLTDNAFGTAEIHDLRIAFETITGEDLNWFFNQWFLSSGHPVLAFDKSYDSNNKLLTIEVTQKQDFASTPLYRLPIAVDLYFSDTVLRKNIDVTKASQSFAFEAEGAPKLVNIDADKMLLCEKEESKSIEEWIYQYNSAPLFLDRKEALEEIIHHIDSNEVAFETLLSSLNDPNASIRKNTIDLLEASLTTKGDEIEALLTQVAKNDKNSLVRARAIARLGDYFHNEAHAPIFIDALQDSSYAVIEEAIVSLGMVSPDEAMKVAKDFENEKNKKILYAIADVYSMRGDSSHHDFFIDLAGKTSGYAKYAFVPAYTDYLSNNPSKELITTAITVLEKFNTGGYFNQMLYYSLDNVKQSIKTQVMAIDEKIKASTDEETITALNNNKTSLVEAQDLLMEFADKVKQNN